MSDENTTHRFTETARNEMLQRRVLVLDGELTDDHGVLLMTQLMALAADDARADIHLWIHSLGGSVSTMLALRDLMRTVPNDVVTLGMGLACGAGQFLLSAGTPQRRYALPHAKILMHQGSSGTRDSAVDSERWAEDVRSSRETVLGLIAEDTGQSSERVTSDAQRDTWYTAEQARQYGFIDHVVTDYQQIALAAARRPVRFVPTFPPAPPDQPPAPYPAPQPPRHPDPTRPPDPPTAGTTTDRLTDEEP